jgi:hypothetical protein
VVLNTSPTLVTPILGAASATSIANDLGAVGTPSYTFTGDLNTGMWSPSADALAFSTAGSERVRVDASGNVGIGTSSPGRKMDILSIPAAINQLNGLRLSTDSVPTSSSEFLLGTDGGGIPFTSLRTGNDGNSYMNFFTGSGPTERARIDSSGNLLVGAASQTFSSRTEITSGNANLLALYNTVSNGGAKLWLLDGNNSAAIGNVGPNLLFYTAGNSSERMRIDSSGNVGIGTTSPAYKLDVAGTAANTISGVRDTTGYAVFRAAQTNAITFFGQDSTAGAISGTANASLVWGNNNHPLLFATNNTERARIDSSGNVGIGTTSPGSRLDVVGRIAATGTNTFLFNGATGTYGTFQYNGTVVGDIGTANQVVSGGGNTDFALTTRGATSLVFGTNTVERARIDSSGNLLVGTTAQLVSEKCGVLTSGATASAIAGKNDAGDGEYTILAWNTAGSGDNKLVGFLTDAGGALRGGISYNRGGGVVAYNTTSDYRAKDILGPVESPGATLDALKVYTGIMKGATVARPMLVAHEAQEVVPYAVTGEKDAVNEDGTDKYQQMDHQVLIPLLIAELQSLRARVAQLEGN